MKKWIIALVVLFASSAFADTTVKFTWTPNPASDNITDYRLYMDGGYENAIVQTVIGASSNSTTYIIVDDSIPHSFALDAHRTSDKAKSDLSDFAIWTPPAAECPECPTCPECPECPPCPEPKPISFTGSFNLVQDQ